MASCTFNIASQSSNVLNLDLIADILVLFMIPNSFATIVDWNGKFAIYDASIDWAFSFGIQFSSTYNEYIITLTIPTVCLGL
jgi:hypothetical protein